MKITKKCQHDEEMTFFVPDSGGYVWCDANGKSGTRGKQICRGGGFRGSTLRSKSNEESLKSVVDKWIRQRRYSHTQAKYAPNKCWNCGADL